MTITIGYFHTVDERREAHFVLFGWFCTVYSLDVTQSLATPKRPMLVVAQLARGACQEFTVRPRVEASSRARAVFRVRGIPRSH